MYRIIYVTIIVLYSSCLNGQVFLDPSGDPGMLTEKKKTIPECNSQTNTIIQTLSYKLGTSARRYQYMLTFWNECYQITGREKGTLFSPCTQQPECNPGWNKAGRISFVRYNNPNNHKLHVGWRADPDNPNQLKLSAYFHEVPDAKGYSNDNNELQDYYVSHYITNINTDYNFGVDMYMSLGTIALKVDNHAVVMRKPGMIPSQKDSYLARSFYFGEYNDCVTPESMSIRFKYQLYDMDNYIFSLNNSDKVTVNLSTFISDDSETFHAFSEIWGSVPNSWANNTYIQYPSDHPNKVRQQCVVQSGADITFEAGGSIKLFPGFHAQQGSIFKAVIVQKEKPDSLKVMPQKANLPPLKEVLADACTSMEEGSFSFAEDDNHVQFLADNTPYRLYPNPNAGVFFVAPFTAYTGSYSVEVSDMLGNKVFSADDLTAQLTRIDLTGRPNGIYFVKILTAEGSFTEKVICR